MLTWRQTTARTAQEAYCAIVQTVHGVRPRWWRRTVPAPSPPAGGRTLA